MSSPDDELRLENVQSQMRKGVLEYCILLVIARGNQVYASDILSALKTSNMIVVEGTIYPLLSRMNRAEYLKYNWVESSAGPPRKYYSLTDRGREALRQMTDQWVAFTTSINELREAHEKTHSANIGGTVFQVEEDAFEHLQAYLQSIETHFRSYPDVAEIVADIEGRIAEQLLQRELAPQVVRLGDVERVIAAMGRTEQFAEPTTEQMPVSEGRKLFRDPEYKVISGVAAGLASYLGLPRLLVRLLFLMLLFFFGTGVVVYLLLWALVPTASSTTDKLQMRGRPLTLASIDQSVRDGIASISPATRSFATRSVTAAGSLIHLTVVTIARALKWVVGVFVVGGAALAVLTLTVLLVVALVNAGAPPLHPDVAAFLHSFGTWQNAFKVFVYLLAAIPLALVITTALKLFWGVNRLNTRGLAGLLSVWVVSLLATAAIWSSFYPELRQYWDEYPAKAEARRGLDRYRALVASTSPLSDAQANALLATLAAEHKRRRAEDDRFLTYSYGGPLAQLEYEEETVRAREESNLRVVASAQSYLDAQQLALMQDSMARYSTRSHAALQSRRERLTGGGP